MGVGTGTIPMGRQEFIPRRMRGTFAQPIRTAGHTVVGMEVGMGCL